MFKILGGVFMRRIWFNHWFSTSYGLIELLKRNDPHATAKAVDLAFSSLILYEQIQWERDVALGQLEDLGISFVGDFHSTSLNSNPGIESIFSSKSPSPPVWDSNTSR